jgi:hypothetical protein
MNFVIATENKAMHGGVVLTYRDLPTDCGNTIGLLT